MNRGPIRITPFMSDSTYSPGVGPFHPSVVGPMGRGRIATRKRRTAGAGQAGGLAVLPIITAGIEAAKKLKPATKAKEALEKKFGEKHANNILYKIAHGAASVGQSLGFGVAPPPKRKRRTRKKKL